MAKRKKRKQEKKESTYAVEIKGIIMILITIIGLCPFGIAADLIKGFSAFLFGAWYILLLFGIGICGLYMIIKREVPDFFTSKLVGLYIILIGILTLSHLGYLTKLDNKEIVDVFKNTIDNLMAFLSGESDIQGGGIIGAFFGLIFIKLLTVEGTEVVCYVLIICGAIMFTGISIYDIITYLKENAKKLKEKSHSKKIQDEIDEAEEEFEKGKIVISSVDELKQEKKEVKEVEPDNYSGYKLPNLTLISPPSKNIANIVKENKEAIKTNIELLEKVIGDFGIDGKIVAANIGPAVTQYEMNMKSGTKVSKILGINREIALALGAKDVRIQAPIPGKKTVGIELPNKKVTSVALREILETKANETGKLMVGLGKDIMGSPIHCNIDKTPHLLVAGSTGSGKSVCINSMLISLLMRTKPDEVKIVLVDPKKVELSIYNGVPHLLTPVVTDPKKANIALKKIVVEMERRYDVFSETGTKNIAGYNKYIENKNKSLDDSEKIKALPYIVVIIDELADLMLVAAKEVEDSIMRITQMARAAGIHLIVATQRPSTDVITGVVKANIPSRISFAVSSNIDSRTILDMGGAEKLLGKGDMLFLPQGENTPVRVQGNFVSDEDIKKVVDYTISQQKARYDETFLMSEEEKNGTTMVEKDATEEPLYDEIVEFVITQGKASASLLQRRFRLGYNRAARAIDLLEERGIVGPSNGSKPREVLVKLEKEE